MSNLDSKILGLEQVLQNLSRIEETVRKKVVRQALRKGGDYLVDKLRSAVPRDTGELADNINRVRRKDNIQGEDEYAVSTGKAYWGAFHEFGTGVREPRKADVLMNSAGTIFGVKAKGIRPNPWFTRTWEANKERVLNEIREVIQAQILKRHRRGRK